MKRELNTISKETKPFKNVWMREANLSTTLNMYQVNFIAFCTILRKEIVRFMRIWTQTLLPSAITQTLYFLIFGAFIGSRVGNLDNIPYMQFILPGLIMMAIITNAFSNTVGSFFGAKFQKNIEEMLVAPVHPLTIILGFSIAGIARGMLVGIIVYAVSLAFVSPTVDHPFIIILFSFLTAFSFSLAGLLNGIFAQKFDDVGIIPTFVLIPLTYLGWVFYSLQSLPPFWRTVSEFNPIVYMIDGFRYGFYGLQSLNVWYSFSILLLLTIVLFGANWYLLAKGKGLKF